MAKKASIIGLYAVTPDGLTTEMLLEKVGRAIAGGAGIVQYRNKSLPPGERLLQAAALAALVRKQHALFIVNDSMELALQTDADGVHLGRDDGDVAAARSRLPNRLIGVSCYDSLERADAAVAAGADYVAFGAAYPSASKPGAVRAPLPLYREARRRLPVPIVAIGGIDPANAGALIEAGVDAVAVISALFDADDITATARSFAGLFQQARP